jgi:hypothetical protein
VTADQLLAAAIGDVGQAAGLALLEQEREEVDLEEDVTELVDQLRVVARVRGVRELVGLLDRVRHDRALVLLAVPRALAPQPAGDLVERERASEVRPGSAAANPAGRGTGWPCGGAPCGGRPCGGAPVGGAPCGTGPAGPAELPHLAARPAGAPPDAGPVCVSSEEFSHSLHDVVVRAVRLVLVVLLEALDESSSAFCSRSDLSRLLIVSFASSSDCCVAGRDVLDLEHVPAELAS